MSEQKETSKRVTPPAFSKYLIGGASGMGATMCVQPLDLVKNRMQIAGAGSGKKEYRNSFHCIQTVVKREGPLALYQGISAALLRQATYTTGRLGMYTYLNEEYRTRFDRAPNVVASMVMGMIAGASGAFIGTPAEVALIRMTSDGRLPMEERRNYKNVGNALARITREEGVAALWRGCLPTVGRAMVVNMTQLASYSQFKSYFRTGPLQMEEGIKLHFFASMLSGLLTTITSMPLDIAKTRIQNMKMVDGKAEYKGTMDVLLRVARHEGIFSLWKGFTPYYFRLGPHTVLTFILMEQLNGVFNKYVLGTEKRGSGI
ncbi:mitochondrial 2-oxoglutarate/malate carrier protein [Drosophila grimshawi]|uniref:Mitochondrial 2-oxoglutarate/malate carrier protein n=1 Tax=Drosophila grimshawi TaxID=7222 RepID=B4JGU0_DROGR|nr:mitochondrial 2-oxoglutarate/malate carrier protein [Drosophila grimshawi]EDV92694.1 GH18903 [Drosophila grimshawi]